MEKDTIQGQSRKEEKDLPGVQNVLNTILERNETRRMTVANTATQLDDIELLNTRFLFLHRLYCLLLGRFAVSFCFY